MNQQTRQFISEHIDANVHHLALQTGRFPEVDMTLAIRQINGKQKTKSKIPTFFHSEELLYPAQLSLEQSSSESTAKYKSSLCEGKTIADLTGGFGVDCYFMSKSFERAIYVERQEELCELARHNFKTLNSPHIKVVHAITEEYLTQMQPVDWIYLDPARRSSTGKKVVLLSDCEPDVSALASLLLEKAGNIMIKLSPMMDITAAVLQLPTTREIHIISTENECKEILLILDLEPHNNPRIVTINFGKNKTEFFEYYSNDEAVASIDFADEINKYLYEPNSSVMKSGAFKLIASHFGLIKLHKNTHLYTSTQLIPDFPGRTFEVEAVWGHSKKDIKSLSEKAPKANITTRNYPTSADDLRKKLKIKEGGDIYLFGCTLMGEKKTIIECKKISSNSKLNSI